MGAPFMVVIPARYASTRLPGKPLLDIAGKPMIQHVWERVRACSERPPVIATDDTRIEAAARAFGADVHMTAATHGSGTDRIAEVVGNLREPEDSIIVNVQGDEPLLPGALVMQVAQLLEGDPAAVMATLSEPITEARDVFDPNVVKVVSDRDGHALYFSRAPIPWNRDDFRTGEASRWPSAQGYHRHLGIYAYRAGFLRTFTTLPPVRLEKTEALEQLRALYYGYRIRVAEACVPSGPGVDTPADLERARVLLAAHDWQPGPASPAS
jgi:3-deoxy-manno-octulosonate cytidylyltransferase (CMP-KDO synthetase)